MKAYVTIERGGEIRKIAAESGELLSDVLRRHGVKLDMPCGGKGTCGGCAVRVDGEELLACRTAVERDLRVELPSEEALQNIATGKSVAASAGEPMFSRLGFAVDIGTTTLCASLSGPDGELGAAVRKNPQTVIGGDVVSRIEHALAGGGGELAELIRAAIAEMIAELCAKNNVSPDMVDAAVITGNTVMLCLLVGHSPESLARAPFKADRLFGEYVDADTLGLGLAPGAEVYLPRCMSAFVGADITTALIASGICDREETAVLADIGTNGEIALWHGGKLSCCSTAAGPAFEGAGVEYGMYGAKGAIDRVWLEGGELRCNVIGSGPAIGICGSGIIDALSVMLELGAIDETGAFDDGDFFELRDGVGITAADVRKIQLAKGSVRAGLETLLEASDTDKRDVGALCIAGGFGSYMRLESAAAIGLVPGELVARASAIGNAAHTGAIMLLRDKSLAEAARSLAVSARTVPLDANPTFADNYMTYMMFE